MSSRNIIISTIGLVIALFFLSVYLIKKYHRIERLTFMEKENATLEIYTVAWCRFCKEFTPLIPDITRDMKSIGVHVDIIDADRVTKDSLNKRGVKGFPTIILVPRDGDQEMVRFTGERTRENIRKWVESQPSIKA